MWRERQGERRKERNLQFQDVRKRREKANGMIIMRVNENPPCISTLLKKVVSKKIVVSEKVGGFETVVIMCRFHRQKCGGFKNKSGKWVGFEKVVQFIRDSRDNNII